MDSWGNNMRAKEVLELLGITRPTLSKYVKQGLEEFNLYSGQRWLTGRKD